MNVTFRRLLRWKAIIVTYSDCGSVAFNYPACKADAPDYIVICGLSVCLHHASPRHFI